HMAAIPGRGPRKVVRPCDPHRPSKAISVRAEILAPHDRAKPVGFGLVAGSRGDWLRVGGGARTPVGGPPIRPALAPHAVPTTRPRFGRKYGASLTARS